MVGLLALTALAGVCCPAASAQVIPTAAPPAPTAPAPAADAPRTAPLVPVQPGLPPPAEAPPGLPGPYLVPDPVLDNPNLPPLGWFAEVDVALVAFEVNRQSFTGGPFNVGPTLPGLGPGGGFVPQGPLSWTVTPRVQVGYRLPSGFGEVAVAFREMASDGDGPNSATTRVRNRLELDYLDLEYANHEFSLWPWGEMRWKLGLRFADVYLSSQQAVSPVEAVARGDLVTQRDFGNWYYGVGPLAGVQLAFPLHEHDAMLLCRIDGASVVGRIHQHYTQIAAPDATGASQTVLARFNGSDVVPVMTVQVGFLWRPRPELDVFLGYQFEKWWEVLRLADRDSRGDFWDQGIVARASFCW
jgi:hypothetical protein